MRPDLRWLTLGGAELALMVAFMVFANAHGWSSAAGTWTVIAYLVTATLANDRIERWAGRRGRRRGSHR